MNALLLGLALSAPQTAVAHPPRPLVVVQPAPVVVAPPIVVASPVVVALRHALTVEEFARVFPPVVALGRSCTRDVELAGTQLKQDDFVMLCYAASSRDPRVVDDPTTIDIDRETVLHSAFGVGPIDAAMRTNDETVQVIDQTRVARLCARNRQVRGTAAIDPAQLAYFLPM